MIRHTRLTRPGTRKHFRNRRRNDGTAASRRGQRSRAGRGGRRPRAGGVPGTCALSSHPSRPPRRRAVHCHVSQGRSSAASPSRALTRASGLPAQPGSRSPGGLGPCHPGVSSASRSAEHRAGRQAACKCRQGRRTLPAIARSESEPNVTVHRFLGSQGRSQRSVSWNRCNTQSRSVASSPSRVRKRAREGVRYLAQGHIVSGGTSHEGAEFRVLRFRGVWVWQE